MFFVTNFEQTQAISFKVEELQCGNWATIVTCEVVSFSGKRSAIAQAARIGSSLSLVVGGQYTRPECHSSAQTERTRLTPTWLRIAMHCTVANYTLYTRTRILLYISLQH